LEVSKDFEGKTDKVEPWYQADYSVNDIPQSWLEKWKSPGTNPDLKMIAPNPFVPDDVSIKPPPEIEARYPWRLEDTPQRLVWFKQDTVFQRPRAVIHLALTRFYFFLSVLFLIFSSPHTYENPINVIKSSLLSQICKDNINE